VARCDLHARAGHRRCALCERLPVDPDRLSRVGAGGGPLGTVRACTMARRSAGLKKSVPKAWVGCACALAPTPAPKLASSSAHSPGRRSAAIMMRGPGSTRPAVV
jgi:hypothetical protein